MHQCAFYEQPIPPPLHHITSPFTFRNHYNFLSSSLSSSSSYCQLFLVSRKIETQYTQYAGRCVERKTERNIETTIVHVHITTAVWLFQKLETIHLSLLFELHIKLRFHLIYNHIHIRTLLYWKHIFQLFSSLSIHTYTYYCVSSRRQNMGREIGEPSKEVQIKQKLTTMWYVKKKNTHSLCRTHFTL